MKKSRTDRDLCPENAGTTKSNRLHKELKEMKKKRKTGKSIEKAGGGRVWGVAARAILRKTVVCRTAHQLNRISAKTDVEEHKKGKSGQQSQRISLI